MDHVGAVAYYGGFDVGVFQVIGKGDQGFSGLYFDRSFVVLLFLQRHKGSVKVGSLQCKYD